MPRMAILSPTVFQQIKEYLEEGIRIEWLDESPSTPLSENKEQLPVVELPLWLNEPWPTVDILSKLIEAAEESARNKGKITWLKLTNTN